ncbi:MAG: DHHW family protein, partial [Lachnospiraceae bacterium]
MRKYSTMLMFLTIIFGLTILSILKKPVFFSENENRFLEQKPDFFITSLFDGSYTAKYESYITDQFIYRDSWIGIKTRSERLLGRQDIHDVYFGKDNYFIEKHTQEKFESTTALTNIDTLTAFIHQYDSLNTLQSLNVLLVPTASEILKDKLPPFAAPYPQKKYLNLVENAIGSDHFISILDTLNENKDAYIYYKTDHHWTAHGAYLAYREWATSIGLTPFDTNEFSIKTVTDTFFGTITPKIGIPVNPDSMELYIPPSNFSFNVTFDDKSTQYNSLYFFDALNKKDKYTIYLDGNHPLTAISSNADSNRNLLVIKDSYAHCFV